MIYGWPEWRAAKKSAVVFRGFEQRDLRSVLSIFPEVESGTLVSRLHDFKMQVLGRKVGTDETMIVGVDPTFHDALARPLIAGRGFEDEDLRSVRSACIIPLKLAKKIKTLLPEFVDWQARSTYLKFPALSLTGNQQLSRVRLWNRCRCEQQI